MLRFVKGDLLEAKEDFICHQVNCMSAMGSGIANQIADKWPQVKTLYLSKCQMFDDRRLLLGKVQSIKIDEHQYVLNIFSQYTYGSDKNTVYTNYPALQKALYLARLPDKSYAFPYHFGCGLANGDWTTVRSLIEKILAYDHEVVIYKRYAT